VGGSKKVMKLKNSFIKLNPAQRLYGLKIPVIGLTGGIATGKSTVAGMLEQSGLPIINADQLVKDIYRLPETLTYIQNHHPEVIKDGKIQFPLLREKVFLNPEVKREIETFIYQRLPFAFQSAFEKLPQASVLIYDVPLLFEKKMEGFFDLNALVYATREVQLARLISRDKISEMMANQILNQQMDIEEKRLKTDFIIDNSKTQTELLEEVNSFLQKFFEK
jgi:dephospho-CoA kinase